MARRIGDAAVQAKTGRAWAEWFAVLDEAGAAAMSHKEIAALLLERHGLPGWWAQMVTVTYEQERGLREEHERPEGYQISGSRTIGAAVSALYEAWAGEEARRRWLGDVALVVRKATPEKSLRITWSDGRTSVDVDLHDRGNDRSRVSVEHSKLADADEAARMKAFWAEALDRLRELLETGGR